MRQRIGVNTDEKVGLRPVGNIGTLVEWDENIGLAGIDDPNIGTVALHHSSESKRHLQVDILLL